MEPAGQERPHRSPATWLFAHCGDFGREELASSLPYPSHRCIGVFFGACIRLRGATGAMRPIEMPLRQ